MTPTELRALVAAMTPEPWTLLGVPPDTCFIEPAINVSNGYDGEIKGRDALGIITLRNLAPALVELWEAVERYTEAVRQVRYLSRNEGASMERVDRANEEESNAYRALSAAAKRVGGRA